MTDPADLDVEVDDDLALDLPALVRAVDPAYAAELVRDLDLVAEHELVAELVRRGWVTREQRIPVACDRFEGEPVIVIRELSHRRRVEGGA